MTFTILSVCTGNICRSPIAEYLIAEAMRGEDVVVASAGVGALVGKSAPQPAQALAKDRGMDISQHVAQQVGMDMIRRADLVLGMARDHRRHLVEMMPSIMRRTFTLREFARLTDAAGPQLPQAVAAANARTPAEGMRAAVALAASLRGTILPPSDASEFDVVDPYRQSDDVYRRSFEELIPAADRVSSYLLDAGRLALVR
ncbi:low molecular weight phosphatase family protein [Microbacterium sp.]|uniref:arsenate reductase/protein-tyrosine-phosphatase family protein n=1 Tax=Microbacterium sp. TaxID=51671 RepID=UPI0025D6A212|nr:low molecular weight phosphatase family protein [Microbacterium sp.]MBT9606338.1 low molecular weight phosphatase family protein [Microbacterium sp.]